MTTQTLPFPHFLLLLHLNLQDSLPWLNKGAHWAVYCTVLPSCCPGTLKTPHCSVKSPNPVNGSLRCSKSDLQSPILFRYIPLDMALCNFIASHCNWMQSKGNLSLFSFQFLGGQEELGLLWTTKENRLCLQIIFCHILSLGPLFYCCPFYYMGCTYYQVSIKGQCLYNTFYNWAPLSITE